MKETKQSRIDEAENFFNLHFAAVNQTAFSYLWAKQNKKTFFFDVSTADNRHAMAIRAIELNDAGFDVFFGVNLQSTPPKSGRGKEIDITFQTAIICDIDTLGGEHKNTRAKQYPANFETARSFLPFKNSININSGYGLHGYCLFQELIPVNDETRLAIKSRDKKFIDAIRANAGTFSKVVDGVGDLSRVLRVPGTRNYKCGISDDAPLCHIVEVNDTRFTSEQIDELLNAPIPEPLETPKQSTPAAQVKSTDFELFDSPKPTDTERALAMLNFIPCSEVTYEDWLQVGMILKNTGNPCSDWELWSRADYSIGSDGKPRYKQGECEYKWAGFNGGGLTIATLHDLAKLFGYSEKDFQRDWYQQRKGTSRIIHRPEPRTDLSHDDDDQQKDFIWTQNKIKSCPVNLRLPDDFKFNRNGIVKIIPAKKETDPPKYIRACRAPIIPTKKFREPIKNTLEYGLAIYSDDEWRNIEVDAAIIGDTRELSKILNRHGGLVDEPKIISQFINSVIALNPKMQRIKSYNKTGWTDDDCTEFIYPHADAPYILRREGFSYDKILKSKGDPELWKQKFVEVCAKGGAIATAYFGVALSSALVKPILGFNPSAHLFGKSGDGKTALQKFIASTYGNPRELVGTFAATNKNRLLTAYAFSGLPNFYDELETIQGKIAEEQLSNDAYNFYCGKGNQANKRDGTARESFKFDSARLTTGERPYLKQHDLRGAFKRVLQLETRRILDPYFNENNLTGLLPDELAADLHFFSESNFGHFGKIWTDFVAMHKDEIQKQYEHFATVYIPLKKYEPTHLKILAGAFVSVEFFAVAIGIKTEFDKFAVARNLRCIVDTLPTTTELDDSTRALADLQSYIAGHEKYFARDIKNEYTDGVISVTPQPFESYGKKFDNGEIAFLPHALKKILENELGYQSADALIAEFARKGLLRCGKGKGNGYRISTRINGKPTPTYRFYANAFSTNTDNETAGAEESRAEA